MQIAESALLEKEQATIKEQQLAREVDRLKSTMATIVKEAGERTKREASDYCYYYSNIIVIAMVIILSCFDWNLCTGGYSEGGV